MAAQLEPEEKTQPETVQGQGKAEATTKAAESAESQFLKKVAESARPPEEGTWLEIRPFVGQELRVVNLLEVVNLVAGSGQVFEFLIAAGPEPSEMRSGVPFPRRVVRYFIRCPDPQTREQVKNLLQAARFVAEERRLIFEGGRLLWHEPDTYVEYPYEAELELAADYGSRPLFPELPTYERSFEQFIDVPRNIYAAVLTGGALRFVFRRNDRAPVFVKSPAAAKDGSSVAKAGSYFLGKFLQSMMRGGRPNGVEEERRLPQPDLRAQQDFMRRISQIWFSCDVRAYGTQEQVRAITASLSFPSNQIKVFRLRKCPRTRRPDPGLQELKKLLRIGAIISFPVLLVFLWGAGIWSPLGVLSNFFDQLLLAMALVVPLAVWAAWRTRKTIALTIGELPLLISLPNRPETGHFYFAEARTPVEIRGDVKAQKGASECPSGE